MQTITQSGTSSVIFHLDKVKTIPSAVYQFHLTNQVDKVTTTFSSVDVSPTPDYYNMFDWVNGVTYSPSQGRFTVDPGVYFLHVYEYEPGFTGTPSLIHTGEIKVPGPVIPGRVEYMGQTEIVYFDQ